MARDPISKISTDHKAGQVNRTAHVFPSLQLLTLFSRLLGTCLLRSQPSRVPTSLEEVSRFWQTAVRLASTGAACCKLSRAPYSMYGIVGSVQVRADCGSSMPLGGLGCLLTGF